MVIRSLYWVLFGIMCISSVSLAVSYYDITLPSYPPGEVIWHPASLNDNAQIVGPTSMPVNAYLWQNGAITDIPITQGSFETTATDINNAGHVIGGTGDGPGELYNGSQVISLGTLGGSSSMPFALNESDQVVGSSQTSVTNQIHPFLWQNGTLISLGTLGGNYGRAHDINNQGVVAGFSQDASGDTRAFVYRNGTMTDLGTLGGRQSNAVAINDANEIVGWSQIANGYQHAFIWKNGVMTNLGTLGGSQSQAFDINNSGQILGWAETATGYRVLVIWENGQIVRLNNLIAPDSGWELVLTERLNIDEKPWFHINNNGAILGTGSVNGSSHPFLMLPRGEEFFLHDSNQDGTVNLQDFAQLSNEWMK